MQPRVVECRLKCETNSWLCEFVVLPKNPEDINEVHVFSFFVFTELDTAQPRRRSRVQPILFNIFFRIGTAVDSTRQRQNDAVRHAIA
jgi:hypothetical protein